jgi:hypothetical protein
MAIFHMSVGIISRKAGRSSTGAAAYRAAERLVDERTGDDHDYRRKRGVEGAQIVLPAGCDWRPSRSELWNAIEHKNKRADAQVAREFEVALPAEISPVARKQLAVEFAQHIADRYGVGADVAIHKPSKRGDERNHHAHILTTTNRVERDGRLGNKVRELDAVAHDRSAAGRNRPNEVEQLRATWADLTNKYLEREGFVQRVDHRSLAQQREAARAQGDHERAGQLDREPTRHLGPAATAIERGVLRERADGLLGEWRRTPRATEIGDANRRIELAAQIGKIRQERSDVGRALVDTQTTIEQALKERDERRREGRDVTDAQGLAARDGREGLHKLQVRQLMRPNESSEAAELRQDDDQKPSALRADSSVDGGMARQGLAERFAQLLKPGRSLSGRGIELSDQRTVLSPTQEADVSARTGPERLDEVERDAASDKAQSESPGSRLQEVARRISESRHARHERPEGRDHPDGPDLEP